MFFLLFVLFVIVKYSIFADRKQEAAIVFGKFLVTFYELHKQSASADTKEKRILKKLQIGLDFLNGIHYNNLALEKQAHIEAIFDPCLRCTI